MMRLPAKAALTAFAGALAAMAAFMVPAVPASAATAHSSVAAHVSAVPEDAPCFDGPGWDTKKFDRCTSSSPTGTYSGVDCTNNHNYNAANGPFNVYGYVNNCHVRVWLHQYKDWSSGGWAYCISPNDFDFDLDPIFPENIYISSSAANCR